MFHHILLPIDGSEACTRAVEKGAELAKALGAVVTLMTAIEQYPAGLTGAIYRAEDNPMHQAARDAGAHWLAQAEAVVRKHGIEPKQMIMEDRSVAQSIVAAATTAGADLIVMGSHGAGALERLLIGSQTQRVLAQTSIAVMVLR
jgi:nucleotide-binding universal stress UspA family protein